MNQERERSDLDSPWKEILEAYFPQAMQFFFPQTAALINWERPHEFLDKEFQQIVRQAQQGRRYADKLVKVWQIQGLKELKYERAIAKTISAVWVASQKLKLGMKFRLALACLLPPGDFATVCNGTQGYQG